MTFSSAFVTFHFSLINLTVYLSCTAQMTCSLSLISVVPGSASATISFRSRLDLIRGEGVEGRKKEGKGILFHSP